MAKRVEWDKWRKKYIQGDDKCTLEAISKMPGSPAFDTLRAKSRKEGWIEQRRHYRSQVAQQTASLPEPEQVAAKVEQLIDAAEIITRHVKFARALQGKVVARLNTLDPNELKPADLVSWLKASAELERLSYGLATTHTKEESDQKIQAEIKAPTLIQIVPGAIADDSSAS